MVNILPSDNFGETPAVDAVIPAGSDDRFPRTTTTNGTSDMVIRIIFPKNSPIVRIAINIMIRVNCLLVVMRYQSLRA
jgi:hypothetical protein